MHVDITSVFILAQNRLLREALARLLSKKADLRIAGASDFSPQLVQLIAQASPDVLLSDPTALAIRRCISSRRFELQFLASRW